MGSRILSVWSRPTPPRSWVSIRAKGRWRSARTRTSCCSTCASARSCALTLQYDKILFSLEPVEQAKAAIGKRVTVVDYHDGPLSILHKGIELAYRTFDKIQQVDQGAIVENKRLGAALTFIREEQLRREPQRRSTKAPRRRDQRGARLFKVG
jgi:hypothetical protein